MTQKTYKSQIVIDLGMEFNSIPSKIAQLQKYFDSLKLPDKMRQDVDKTFDNFNTQLKDFQSRLGKDFKTKGDITGLAKSGDTLRKYTKEIEGISRQILDLPENKLREVLGVDEDTTKKLKEIDSQITELKQKLNSTLESGNFLSEAKKLINEGFKTDKAKKSGGAILDMIGAGNLEDAKKGLEELYNSQLKVKSLAEAKSSKTGQVVNTENIQANLDTIEQLRTLLANVDDSKIVEIQQLISNLQVDKVLLLNNAFNDSKGTLEGAANSAHKMSKNIGEMNKKAQGSAEEMYNFNHQLDALKSRANYFFSLANGINLIKRMLRDTVNTVKELDKSMTEIAVVTDFSVGDMWEQLPQYTKRANELGVSIKSVYDSSALFYEQGIEGKI